MTSLATRILVLLAALATVVALAGCTSPESADAGDGHTGHEHSGSAAPAPADSADQQGHNADDVTFAQQMTAHHKQALELTDLARDRSTDPALLELSAAIAAAQGPEIGQMAAMLRSWGQNPDADMGHGGHSSMAGMVDSATMDRLRSLNGKEFDTLWLESMISHHQGAVEMAKAEIANGDNAEAKQLAERIVDTQQAEIDQMKQMLGG
jgi:uncharacterized protein (DUF305 family)